MRAWQVTVVIPTIPPRARMLERAYRSVQAQMLTPDSVVVSYDLSHAGAAATRNKGLASVQTEWVAFLDDDDELLPHHLEVLVQGAAESGADLVYPWFDVPEGFDPFPVYEGQEFRPEWLETQNMIPVTVLARTALLQDVGGFQALGPADNPCDDWGAWKALLRAGAKFHHVNCRSWLWHWHGGNTSGRGDRW